MTLVCGCYLSLNVGGFVDPTRQIGTQVVERSPVKGPNCEDVCSTGSVAVVFGVYNPSSLSTSFSSNGSELCSKPKRKRRRFRSLPLVDRI